MRRYGRPAAAIGTVINMALYATTSIVPGGLPAYTELTFILVELGLGFVVVASWMKTYGKWVILIVVGPALILFLYYEILRLLP